MNLEIKHRPRTFDDIAGQPIIVKELQKMSINKENFPKAMLFSGMTGTGKTSLCYQVAALLNCQNPKEARGGDGVIARNPCGLCPSCMDVAAERWHRDILFFDGSKIEKEDFERIEREISVVTMYDENSVVIIEEIQEFALTRNYGKLLKMVEHPQEKVYFLFTTMALDRVPKALQKRCCHFKLNPVEPSEIAEYLMRILKAEGLSEKFGNEELMFIAKHSDGDVRSAVKDLTRCIISNYYTKESMQEALGYLNEDDVKELLSKLQMKEIAAFKDLNKVDVPTFFKDSWPMLIDSFLEVTKNDRKSMKGMNVQDDENKQLRDLLDAYQKVYTASGGSFNKNLFYYYILDYFNKP